MTGSLALRRPAFSTCSAWNPCSTKVRASRGGSWASTRKRSKSGDFQNGVVHFRSREFEAGTDVLRFQIRKVFEDLLFGHAGGEHFEHILHPDAHPANAWATAALLGVEGDAIKVFHKARI